MLQFQFHPPFPPPFEHYGVVLCHNSLREDGSGSAYDKESMAIIKLNNTTVLYLKEVTKFLALVCILREESFERKGKLSGRPAIHQSSFSFNLANGDASRFFFHECMKSKQGHLCTLAFSGLEFGVVVSDLHYYIYTSIGCSGYNAKQYETTNWSSTSHK